MERKETAAEKEKKRQKFSEQQLLVEEDTSDLNEIGTVSENIKMKRNTLKISHTALATIRTEATNRQASAIVTGFLQDLIDGGILPSGSEYLAVDPKKIHHALEETMKDIHFKEEKSLQEENLNCILIDSRLTDTKI